ncbi:MAG: DUF2971 domain-containing protein [Chthoniobacterales bacterium]
MPDVPTPPRATPPRILYKYLGPAGAKAFLDQPQLRFTKFIDLDDILDTQPGFTPLTDEQARANAIERVHRSPAKNVSVEHQIIFFENLGKISPEALEAIGREVLEEQAEFPYVCSLSAEPGSLAMWSLYAQRHSGIVFGITSDCHRLISASGRVLQKISYSPLRPNTPFNNPKVENVVSALWTKGTDWEHQQEWRILAHNGTTDYLIGGEVKEVIFGYRYDPIISGAKEEHMGRDVFQQTKFFDAFPSPTEYKMATRPTTSA